MDFPFLSLHHLLEDSYLGPLIFSPTLARAPLDGDLVHHFHIRSPSPFILDSQSMPNAHLVSAASPAPDSHNTLTRSLPNHIGRAAVGFNPGRVTFGLGFPPRPNLLNSITRPGPGMFSVPSFGRNGPSTQPNLAAPASLSRARGDLLPPHLAARATPEVPLQRDQPLRGSTSDDFLNESLNYVFPSSSLSPQGRSNNISSSLPSIESHFLGTESQTPATRPLAINNVALTGPATTRERLIVASSPSHPTATQDKMPLTRRASQSAAPSSSLEVDVIDTCSTQPRQHLQAPLPLSNPDDQASRKRKRGVPSHSQKFGKDHIDLDSDDSPFADSKDRDVEVIDLADTEEIPDLGQPTYKGHEVRLGGLQCVICMDDTSNLTVTHCGHLFCGECLHSSLQIDSNKKICPICRQKIDLRQAAVTATASTRAKVKGLYPLRLKLMTAKRRGKRTAR